MERVRFGTNELFDVAAILQMLVGSRRSGTLILACPGRWAMLRLDEGRLADGQVHGQTVATALDGLPEAARTAALRATIQGTLADVLTWRAGSATLVTESAAATDGPRFDLDTLLIEAVVAQDERCAGAASVAAATLPPPTPSQPVDAAVAQRSAPRRPQASVDRLARLFGRGMRPVAA